MIDRLVATAEAEPVRSLPLVSAIDRNYVIPWSAMVTSFNDHNRDRPTTAFVLHYDLTDDDLTYLARVSANTCISLKPIRIPGHPFLLFDTRRRNILKTRTTMSPIAYAKAFVDRFVPDQVARALIVDADMIICGSFADLLDLENENPVAAAANMPRAHHHHFNTGLVLADLSQWRKLRVSETAERFLFAYSDALHSHDEHVLNLIFRKNWRQLDLRWNYIEDHYRFRERNSAYTLEEILAARENPVVVHYAVSDDKPWREKCKHPLAHYYHEYVKRLRPLRVGLDLVEPQ